MKEKFWKYYLYYVYVVLSTHGFAHSPKLSDIGEITEASWEFLWERHLTNRRLWHMFGGWHKQNQCPERVHSNMWWLHAILRESPTGFCNLSDVT
jgi:hypothetical protein